MSDQLKLLDVSAATPDQMREILKQASDIRKFEIDLFWKRSTFFWGFIAGSFIAYANLDKATEADARIAVSCFGFVCSWAWTLQNRGSKYWQEAWETKLNAVEFQALGAGLFSNTEPRKSMPWPEAIFGARRFSVSGLTIALSDFTTFIWVVLAVLAAWPGLATMCWFALLPAISLLFASFIAWANRRRDR